MLRRAGCEWLPAPLQQQREYQQHETMVCVRFSAHHLSVFGFRPRRRGDGRADPGQLGYGGLERGGRPGRHYRHSQNAQVSLYGWVAPVGEPIRLHAACELIQHPQTGGIHFHHHAAVAVGDADLLAVRRGRDPDSERGRPRPPPSRCRRSVAWRQSTTQPGSAIRPTRPDRGVGSSPPQGRWTRLTVAGGWRAVRGRCTVGRRSLLCEHHGGAAGVDGDLVGAPGDVYVCEWLRGRQIQDADSGTTLVDHPQQVADLAEAGAHPGGEQCGGRAWLRAAADHGCARSVEVRPGRSGSTSNRPSCSAAPGGTWGRPIGSSSRGRWG